MRLECLSRETIVELFAQDDLSRALPVTGAGFCLSEMDQHWSAGAQPLPLVFFVDRAVAESPGQQGNARYAVTAQQQLPEALLQSLRACSPGDSCELPYRDLQLLAKDLQMETFVAARPLPLQTVSIAKPWGQELWYTGIEARGVSCLGDTEYATPIPWLQHFLHQYLQGQQCQDLILLKILDPLAEPVFGDLYFELHERKQEVYVVTHIDRRAWPDGVGRIKFGFCRQKQARFPSVTAFQQAYLEAVNAYRRVRLAIDEELDSLRESCGYGLNEPLPASSLRALLEQIEPELQRQELELRQEMDSFSGALELRVGDVLKVPCRVPHSLQHGVRTIEFQTPVYERKILSFAQKVLTQAHWDTEDALAGVDMDPAMPLPELLQQDAVVSIERVVDFSDFEVLRISLAAGGQYRMALDGRYALMIGIEGAVCCAGRELAPEQAWLLPAACGHSLLANRGEARAVFLWARPQAPGVASV